MPRKIKKPTSPELLEAANQTLADRLESIDKGEPVLCQHLKRTNNHFFCACSNHVEDAPEECLYRKKTIERVQYDSAEELYINRCYQLVPDDLKLLYLSRMNHPMVNFTLDKYKKTEQEEDEC